MNDPDRYPEKFHTIEEQMERLGVLGSRLPKEQRGFGIYRRERVIDPSKAQTDQEFEDATEFQMLAERLSKFKNIYLDILVAVWWARGVFHAHGFPSRCFICFSHDDPDGKIIDGSHARLIIQRIGQSRRRADFADERNSMEPRIHTIYEAIQMRRISWAEEGSPLVLASRILSLFQQIWQQRAELLDDEGRNRAQGTLDPPMQRKFDFSRPFTSEYLIVNAFNLGRVWGELGIRRSVEDEVVAMRDLRSTKRSTGKLAGPVHTKDKEERRTRWFAHLDECAESEAWLLLSDALQAARAIEKFKRKLKKDSDLQRLFSKWGKAAYTKNLAEWRHQRIEKAVKSEKLTSGFVANLAPNRRYVLFEQPKQASSKPAQSCEGG